MASIAVSRRRGLIENRSRSGNMRSSGESGLLSVDAQATEAWKRLLWRSGIAVLVITGLIFVVALLPYPSVKQEIHADRQACGPHDHLRHVIVLHRHGAELVSS